MPLRSLAQIGLLAVSAAIFCTPAFAEGPPVIAQRFKGAERAVVGRIAAVQPRWERNQWGDLLIVSRMAVDVEETLRGVATKRLEVDIEGGTLDGLTLHVSHQPALALGDRAVLILNEAAPGVQVPHRKGLGVMRVDADGRVEGTGLTLPELRSAARAALLQ